MQVTPINNELNTHFDPRFKANNLNQLAVLIHKAADAIISVDANQRIILFNLSAEKIFGCSAQEAVGRPLDRFIPQCFRAIRQNNNQNFEGMDSTNRSIGALGALKAVRSDGNEFPIELSISQADTGEGKLFTLILRDISERKRAEDALVRLSRAVEQTADNVFITDREGRIEYINPAFEKVTGYSSSEVIGRTPRLLKSGEHSQAFYEVLWSTILSGNTYRGDFINRKKNGDLYYEEKTITPIKDPEGQITHFVSTGKDITERVRAFHELEELVEDRTREAQMLYAQAEQQRRGLEALYRADEYLYRHLRLEQVLQALVDVVVDILGADKASVQVWDEARQRLAVRASRNYHPEMIAVMNEYVPGDGISGTVYQTGESIAVEDARNANPPANAIAEVEGICSVLSVPLKLGDKIFGVFGMDYCQPRKFSEEDKRLFKALAQRAARAIENARLYEQAEQAAALEERQRLARELHDSVTQSLYSLMLMAGAGRRLAESGDFENAKGQINRIGETAQQALKEMRLMVYEMRPLALYTVGLVEAIQQRLDAVEKRAGVQTELEVQGPINLPAEIAEELYRITQEGLNNSLKHAVSTMTRVRVHSNGEYLSIEISDNGVGFDIHNSAILGGMGLDSMRERAKRIGANLVITSELDQGTTVKVRAKIPIVPVENTLNNEMIYE